MAQFQFSTAGIEPAEAPQERLPLPEGKYNAVITDSEMRATRAGTGHYLNFTWEITSGEHRGRKVWANYNVDNPNERRLRLPSATWQASARQWARMGLRTAKTCTSTKSKCW